LIPIGKEIDLIPPDVTIPGASNQEVFTEVNGSARRSSDLTAAYDREAR
jgi:hypothetical protein